MSEFSELEGLLGHHFNQSELLKQALTHRSYHFENPKKTSGHFERLEFLGDAVLDLLLSELLMAQFTEVDEGTLSKWRASLVNESTLSELARELQLAKFLYLGRSELGERERARPRLLASALEAVIAAIYTDGGVDAARAFIGRIFSARIATLDGENLFATDFKSRLQEWTQKKMKLLPVYKMVSSDGPEHDKNFCFEVLIGDEKWGEGKGPSRKHAEQDAAKDALGKLGEVV